MRTPLPQKMRTAAPILAHVYCGQTVGYIKMPFGTQVYVGPGHIVLDGNPALHPKGAQPPIFGPCLLLPNGWMDQDATWYTEIGPMRHCVRWGPMLDGDPSPPAKKGHSLPPQFSASVCCGQTSGWIKMPLGTEVRLGPGEIVFDPHRTQSRLGRDPPPYQVATLC